MNPRPKIFHTGIYILILNFKVRSFKSPSGAIIEELAHRLVTHSDAGCQSVAILQVDALIGSAGIIREDAGHLGGQSVVIIVCDYVSPHLFYEQIGPRYAT